jgi:hypothetical protein
LLILALTDYFAGHKHAKYLVADDPEREERRSVLKERKDRLNQAGERLRNLNRDVQTGLVAM